MKKIPFGLIIKQLIKEKRFSQAEMAARLGVSRQTIINTFAKEVLTSGEVREWAKALEMPEEEIYARQDARQDVKHISTESLAFGEEVVALIEEHFKKAEEFYQEQLKEKDKQIQKLLELLGKTEGSTYQAELGAVYQMAA